MNVLQSRIIELMFKGFISNLEKESILEKRNLVNDG